MTVDLPAWPDPSSADGKIFFDRAMTVFSWWRTLAQSRRYPHPNAFAIGLTVQAEAESSFDPNALGDYVDEAGRKLPWRPKPIGTPTSFGMHQRKRARTDAIRDGFGDKHGLGFDIAALALAKQNTVDKDLAASLWELDTFPAYGLAAISDQPTAHAAAAQACALFERAGATSAVSRRARMANRWTPWFAGKGF